MAKSIDYEKIPGHWLLASLGKTVLRPGGIQMTRRMLEALHITTADTVVEFAPGLGLTAKLALAQNPSAYFAIEKDQQAAQKVTKLLTKANQEVILGTAEKTGLDDNVATVVYGEAMLTMQSPIQKDRIIEEAGRILQPGGLYAIHEMALAPADLPDEKRQVIRKDLIEAIKVNATPLTVEEWKTLLTSHGFDIQHCHLTPMHLLKPKRLIEDEGVQGVAKIGFNIARHRTARRRVLKMRNTFIKHQQHLQGICLVAKKR